MPIFGRAKAAPRKRHHDHRADYESAARSQDIPQARPPDQSSAYIKEPVIYEPRAGFAERKNGKFTGQQIVSSPSSGSSYSQNPEQDRLAGDFEKWKNSPDDLQWAPAATEKNRSRSQAPDRPRQEQGSRGYAKRRSRSVGQLDQFQNELRRGQDPATLVYRSSNTHERQEKQIKDLQRLDQDRKRDISELYQANGRRKKTVERLEKDVRNLKQDNESLKQANESLKQDHKSLRTQLGERDSRVDDKLIDLKSRLKSQPSDISDLIQRVVAKELQSLRIALPCVDSGEAGWHRGRSNFRDDYGSRSRHHGHSDGSEIRGAYSDSEGRRPTERRRGGLQGPPPAIENQKAVPLRSRRPSRNRGNDQENPLLLRRAETDLSNYQEEAPHGSRRAGTDLARYG